ncbi:MAG: hypothetical protein KBD53_09195 [Candidatus Omnitrophica bacterium]|nr:hypothetical protein [Candidatus Omnitrophota bacterium]
MYHFNKFRTLSLTIIFLILVLNRPTYAQVAITNCTGLQNISQNPTGSYYLANDINCVVISPPLVGGQFTPIRNFRGTFDGRGHTISGLNINQPQYNHVGLFGSITGTGHVKDLIIAKARVVGNSRVGILAGYMETASVSNVTVINSKISGTSQVGGLIGESNNGTGISKSVVRDVTVYGTYQVGGIVGKMIDGSANNITQSSAKVTIFASVANGESVGGLVGFSKSGDIIESYSEGSIQGNLSVGGLVGFTFENAGIHNSYSKAMVSGYQYVGGIAGWFASFDDGVSNTYFAGTVTGNQTVGGFLGKWESGTRSSNYWNITLNPTLPGVGSGDAAGILAKTTSEMFQQSTFIGWDFYNIWIITNGSYPSLRTNLVNDRVRGEAEYILACQYNNIGHNADGAINNVTGLPTWVVPRENGLAILGLIKASEELNDPVYLQKAQRAADYLVRVQDIDNHLAFPYNRNDGAWYNQYSYDQPHDNFAKSPLATAEVMMAFHKLGFNTANDARKNAMKNGAEFLLKLQDVANKGGIDDGLLGAGKTAGNVYEKWRWASDNSFGFLALRAAEKWASLSGNFVDAQKYHDAANRIIIGVNKVLYISNPLDPNYNVWRYAVNENHVNQTEKGRNWINYAPQMLDIPAIGVGDLAVGDWIHTHLQKSDGAVVWADINNSENPDDESKMKSPGYSFQASLAWMDLGQSNYYIGAWNWAVNSGLWKFPVSCDGTVGGWIDWINNDNNTGAQCWERFIDTSFYSITNLTGGYDFNIPSSMPVPNQPSIITVEQGRLLYAQNVGADGTLEKKKLYYINGVTWNPSTRAPVVGPDPSNPLGAGVNYGFFYNPPGVRPDNMLYWWQQEFESHYIEDIKLMKEMGVNTVRIYFELGDDDLVLKRAEEVLDELYLNGIMVIMTVSGAKDDLVSNPPRYVNVVNKFKNHPAILMWTLLNEWNFSWSLQSLGFTSLAEAMTLINQAALNIKALDSNHPVTSALGDDFNNIPLIVSTVGNIDIWGINIYRGASMINPNNVFKQWMNTTTTKPLYISEYGTDSFVTTFYRVDSGFRIYDVDGHVDEVAQGNFISNLYGEILPHMATKENNEQCVGGFIHEFNDEIYKAGNPYVGLGSLPDVNPNGTDYRIYNKNGFANVGQPDGVTNEEYFGLVDADRNPKQAYYVIKSLFKANTAADQNTQNADKSSRHDD